MVLKSSPSSLNTGNTVRRGLKTKPHAAITRTLTYAENSEVPEAIKEGQLFATRYHSLDEGNLQSNRKSDGLHFSLNKKQRWNFSNIVKNTMSAYGQVGSKNPSVDDAYNVTVVEKDLVSDLSKPTCTAVYTTQGTDLSAEGLGGWKMLQRCGRQKRRQKKYFDGDSWLKQTAPQPPKPKVRERKVAEKKGKKGHRDHHKCGQRNISYIAVDRQEEEEEQVVTAQAPEVLYNIYNPVAQTSALAYQRNNIDGISRKSKCRMGSRGHNGYRGALAQYYEYEDGEDDYMDDVAQWTVDDDVDAAVECEYIMDSLAAENERVMEEELSGAMWEEEREGASEQEMLDIAIAESLSWAEHVTSVQKVAEYGLICPKEVNSQARIPTQQNNEEVPRKLMLVENEQEKEAARPLTQDRNALEVDIGLKAIPMTIMMPDGELNYEHLEQTFSDEFMPCDVYPPRFIINITERMRQTLNKSIDGARLDIEGHLVLEKLVVENNTAKVNVSMIGRFDWMQCIRIETLNNCSEYTVDGLLEATDKFIGTLQSDRFLCLSKAPTPDVSLSKSTSLLKELGDISGHLNTEVCIQHPNHAFLTLMQEKEKEEEEKEEEEEEEKNEAMALETTSTISCNVCFEEFESAVEGDVVRAMCLSQCSHYFCMECWRNHIIVQIQAGVHQIRCPEFECSSPVAFETVLSVVGVRLFRQHRTMAQNALLEGTRGVMYCPNTNCGRVHIIRNLVRGFGAHCVCGEAVCAECKGPMHWPLTCTMARKHIDRMKANGDYNLTDDGKVAYIAHVKRCPHCERMMEKNGGCPHMACVCGKSFCWGCGKSYDDNPNHSGCYARKGDKMGTMRKVMRDEGKFPAGCKTKRTELYEQAVSHFRARSHGKLGEYRKQGARLASHIMKSYQRYGGTSPMVSALAVAQHRHTAQQTIFTATNVLIQMHYLLEQCSVLLENTPSKRHLETIDSGSKRHLETLHSGSKRHLETVDSGSKRHLETGSGSKRHLETDSGSKRHLETIDSGSKRHQAAVDSGRSSSSGGGRQHVRQLASMMQFLVAQMHGYLDGEDSSSHASHRDDALQWIRQFNESGRRAVVELVTALQKL